MAFGGFGAADTFDAEALFRVELCIFGPQCQAAIGDGSDAAPGAAHDLKDLSDHGLGGAVALGAHQALVLVLHLVAAFFKLRHAHEDAL